MLVSPAPILEGSCSTSASSARRAVAGSAETTASAVTVGVVAGSTTWLVESADTSGSVAGIGSDTVAPAAGGDDPTTVWRGCEALRKSVELCLICLICCCGCCWCCVAPPKACGAGYWMLVGLWTVFVVGTVQ